MTLIGSTSVLYFASMAALKSWYISLPLVPVTFKMALSIENWSGEDNSSMTLLNTSEPYSFAI